MQSPVKYNLKTEILPWLLIVAAWVLAFYFYPRFPEVVVSHWGINGQPNGYSGKALGAFLLPGIITGIYLLFYGLPFLDPRSERYQSFSNVYLIFRDLIMSVLAIIFAASGSYNLGYNVNIGLFAPLSIGVMFIVLGNYMGKIKPNWFVGIRTPWTMSSENVWNKTHRFGGFIFVAFGLALLLSVFLPGPATLILLIAGAVAVSLGTFVYSYLIFKKEKRGQI